MSEPRGSHRPHAGAHVLPARNQPDDLDEFLQIHLLTWSSHFLDQLVEAADHPFYEEPPPGLRRPRSKAFSKHATST